jgi:aerobic-type carbon monoxide dehydrogenase small subunit (CoxS/CutS family)
MNRPTQFIEFTFNNQKYSAIPGQSIAAALFQANQHILRKTRMDGEERSIFCGIGICWDCVVTVDGVINQRSCIIEVVDGMVVTS